MKLELVQALFRHGERTPLKFEHEAYGADPSLYEPYGLEQLTNNGKKQAYDLGCMLRRRYASFISDRYAPDGELHAYASDTDRTKATLQLVLAGLYPPTPDLTWNPELKWTPVPFRCLPRELDLLLNGDKCPKYLNLRREAQSNSAEFRQIVSEQDSLIALLKSCVSDVNASSGAGVRFHKIFPVFNVLRIHERMNLPLPDWYTSDKREKISQVFHSLLSLMSLTLEMRKINSGPLMKKLLQNMRATTDEKQRSRKMYLYSGHDLNIAAVLIALGMKDAKFPDFASSLIFEKHRDANDEIYVRLLYWQTVGEEMTTLKLNGHDEFCHVDEFAKIVADVIPTDEELAELLSYLDAKTLKDLCLGNC